jgi:hypothetical protein
MTTKRCSVPGKVAPEPVRRDHAEVATAARAGPEGILMSIRSLAAVAVARDNAPAGQPAGGGAGEPAITGADGMAAGRVAGTPPAAGGVPQQFVDVIVHVIPTESLSAYTALLGVASGAITATAQRAYLPFRWWAFGGFLVVTVAATWIAYRRAARGPAGVSDPKRQRAFPWAEGLAALIAAAAWGLAMPGSPLDAEISGTARTLATASIIISAASVLSLVSAPQIKTGAKTTGK